MNPALTVMYGSELSSRNNYDLVGNAHPTALKTIIPSRKMTKKYLRGSVNE
jgi:hypothetical protein